MKDKRSLTLPTDSAERKNYPLLSGCLKYFPAALAGVAQISKVGNDKHNPGQPLHHARGKSADHGDCILRHLMDTEDLLAHLARATSVVSPEALLTEANQLVWRALAYSQQLHEQFGAPLAPSATDSAPSVCTMTVTAIDVDKKTITYAKSAQRELRVGDKVKILPVSTTVAEQMRINKARFVGDMHSLVGSVGVITQVRSTENKYNVSVSDIFGDINYAWPVEVLELV